MKHYNVILWSPPPWHLWVQPVDIYSVFSGRGLVVWGGCGCVACSVDHLSSAWLFSPGCGLYPAWGRRTLASSPSVNWCLRAGLHTSLWREDNCLSQERQGGFQPDPEGESGVQCGWGGLLFPHFGLISEGLMKCYSGAAQWLMNALGPKSLAYRPGMFSVLGVGSGVQRWYSSKVVNMSRCSRPNNSCTHLNQFMSI